MQGAESHIDAIVFMTGPASRGDSSNLDFLRSVCGRKRAERQTCQGFRIGQRGVWSDDRREQAEQPLNGIPIMAVRNLGWLACIPGVVLG